MEKARQIAERHDMASFKGTNGWLDKLTKCYNVKQMAICGESGDVQGETVTSWKEILPEIIRGYNKDDIYVVVYGCPGFVHVHRRIGF